MPTIVFLSFLLQIVAHASSISFFLLLHKIKFFKRIVDAISSTGRDRLYEELRAMTDEWALLFSSRFYRVHVRVFCLP